MTEMPQNIASVSSSPEVTSFFDPDTFTITHIVKDPASASCMIIDPVLDLDIRSGQTSTTSVDKVIAYVKEHALKVELIVETHIHADHLTAANHIKQQVGGKTAVGKHVGEVQETWDSIFNYKEGMKTDLSMFDVFLDDGEAFQIGGLTGHVMYTPGHTSVDITLVIGDAAFIGDTMFMPDYGTARTDFPGGNAKTLYRSIQRILELPDALRVFMCHDYGTAERPEFVWETTIAEAKKNIMIAGLSEEEFVALRETKDAKLAAPKLLYPSLQVNIRSGDLPPAEDNGQSYLKIPIKPPVAAS